MSKYGSINYNHALLTKAERDILQADRPGYGTRSILEVAFNLVNATVGAGIIGLPFAVANAGFYTGVAVSILVAILSQLGLYMVVVAGQRVGIYKFAMLVEYLMGRPGYHFLNFMIFIQAGGACVSYFMLLGDTLPVLFARYVPQIPCLSDRALVMTLTGIIFILPLNMARSVGSLSRWSILSVMCLPVIIVTIMVRAPAYAPPGGMTLTWLGDDVFGALGIMAFAFTCSQVAFNNYLTMHDQSATAWNSATKISTSLSWGVSMIFAVLGFICFGSKVQPNLFLNFSEDDLVVNIGRFALGFSMILTIPMGFYPTREAVQKSLGFETAQRQPTAVQHYVVTFVLFAVVLATSISVHSLGKVYALVGGLSATTLAFILPGAAYFATRNLASERAGPTITTISTTVASYDDIDKTPHFSDVASYASSSRTPFLDEEDASTVNGGEPLYEDDMGKPSRFLDVAAVVLIAWGFMVMIFSTSGVLTQP